MPGISATPRIILACLPRLAADLIRAAIEGGADGDVVADVEDLAQLREVVGVAGANVLVVGCATSELPAEVRELTVSMMPPDAAVIPLDGSGVMLYLLRPHAVALGDVSGAELVEAIRTRLSDRTAA
jgi:hypothetical protein